MFDNLRDKLGSFRKNAEEAAEENVEEVEEVDETELDDEPDFGDDEAREDGAADPTDGAVEDAESGSEGSTGLEGAESGFEGGAELEDAEPDPTADSDARSETAPSEATDTTPAESPSEPAEESVESSDPESEPEAQTQTGSTAESEAATEPTTESEAEATTETAEQDAGGDGRVRRSHRSSPMTGSRPSIDDKQEPEPEPTSESEPVAETDESPSGDETDSGPEDAAAAAEADDSTGFGQKAKSIVRGKFVIEEEDLEGPLHELEMALLSSDVEMGVAEAILDNIRDELVGETRTFTTSTGDVVEEALRDAIYDVISVGQFDFDERIAIEDKPVTIVFTGVNGVGKTTSIAKLSRYFEERGYSTVMANGDTYRAGANEQIQEHADALDTKCISHQQGGDPAAVLYDAVEYAEANDVDIVLGDTAGRLHTDEGLMDQLEKIGRVVDPDMTLFVDEAVAGQDAVNRAREFNDAAEIDGAILTKADADSNGGAAISIAHVTGKPILFLGTGQGYDDIEQFDPEAMADRLLSE